MPVLGHGFVGLGTALCTSPARPEESTALGTRRARLGAVLWPSAMVGLAYLPDIASLVLQDVGVAQGRVIGHSVLFAVLASLVVAPGLTALGARSRLGGWLIGILSVLGHDLLDLLQSTDRMPLWPFSRRLLGFESGLIPGRSLAEAAVFGPLFLLFLVFWRLRGGGRVPVAGPALRRWIAAGWMAASVWMLVAAVVHKVRETRGDKYRAAATLLEQDRPAEALQVLDRPGDWTSTSKPGRDDYLRAEAYRLQGDRTKAEQHYLRAYASDPDYFWLVADLAAFYASCDLPAAERERLVAPYLARLRTEFHDHKDLPRVLARVARKLAAEPRTGSGGG